MGERCDKMENREKCYAFVLNNVEILSPLPFEIIPHHILRRPEITEVEKIREGLKRFGGWIDLTMFFESRYSCNKESTTFRRSSDPKDFRYYVIGVREEFEAPLNDGLIKIERAARLTEFELRSGFFVPRGGGFMYTGFIGDAKFEKLPMSFQQEVTEDHLRDIGKTVGQLEVACREEPRFFEIADTYWHLCSVPANHLLYILGLFTVIESLLTHSPHGGYDSLGHQIKSKMRLLDKRFQQPLDMSPFGTIEPDKLWSKLYEYRSRVAHGGNLEFTGELLVLKSRDTVLRFLEQATKRLLRHALWEPQLIKDLQKC
jgi:hypothetical protein